MHKCQFISKDGSLVCEDCGAVKSGAVYTNEIAFQPSGRAAFEYTNRITSENQTDEEIQKTFNLLKHELEVEEEYFEAFDIAKRLLKLKLANQANDKKIINSLDENEQVKEQLPYLKFYVGAALYFGFRCKQAPYLLIEISDKIPMVIKEGRKVVKLARCYLKLLKFLQQDCPKDKNLTLSQNFQFIDPSIYIPKFVKALEFSSGKQQLIIETTKKLVKRMMLDWMSHGRRPSSLCGAALLISAKFHGENLSTATVCKTVQVCDETIRKRLAEFNQTGLAQLTREQFEQIQNIETEVPGGFNDPPSFKRARQQEKELEDATMQKVLQLTEILNKKSEGVKKTEQGEACDPIVGQHVEGADMEVREELSELGEQEAQEFLLSRPESEYRQRMWNMMYYEWILKQQFIELQKQKQAQRQNVEKPDRKRKSTATAQIDNKSVEDAVKKQFQQHHINEDALKEMFPDLEKKEEEKKQQPSSFDLINELIKQQLQ